MFESVKVVELSKDRSISDLSFMQNKSKNSPILNIFCYMHKHLLFFLQLFLSLELPSRFKCTKNFANFFSFIFFLSFFDIPRI